MLLRCTPAYHLGYHVIFNFGNSITVKSMMHFVFFLKKLGFTEQPLQGMELQEEEEA